MVGWTLWEMTTDSNLGAINPKGMITRKIKLENLVEDGIKTLIHDKDSHVKILVDVNDK